MSVILSMSDFAQTTQIAADQVVDDCMETYRLCRQAAAYCIDRGGDLATLERLKALDDSAEVNLAFSNFILRASKHVRPMAALCMEVSRACAESLEGVEQGEGPLRAAYAASRRSQRVCGELLGDEAVEASYEPQDEVSRESFPASDPPAPPTEL